MQTLIFCFYSFVMDKYLDICSKFLFFHWLTFFVQRNICDYYEPFVHISTFHICVDAYFPLKPQFKCTCCKWEVSHLSIIIFLFSLACDDIILSVSRWAQHSCSHCYHASQEVAMADLNMKNCAS